MPIYDYQCSSCGHKAEVMRKISEPNLTVCPACGSETFAKQVSAPSFQLTGSGWYATDFKPKTSNQ
jgi:putative FmdB family regulatory protein